jgi:hypothetical protein
MCRVLLIVLYLFVGSAAVAAQQAQPPKTSDGRKSVGIISAIGHKFALQKVGITVFGNELKEVPIGSWGIDDLVVAKITAALGKRYDVSRIGYAKGAFGKFEAEGGLFRDREAELREAVRKVAASQKRDFYLVVTRGSTSFGTTNQFVTGLGLVVAGGALVDNSNLVAISVLHLYDGRTFELIKRQSASIGQATFMMTIKGPNRKVDQAWWPSGPAAQSEKLRSATQALVAQSMSMTAPELLSFK